MTSTTAITRDVRISDLLRQVWPRHAAKFAAAASGLSVRTAQAWLSDRCSPSADTLLRMARQNDELRAALLHTLENGPNNDPIVVDRRTSERRAAGAAPGQLGPIEG